MAKKMRLRQSRRSRGGRCQGRPQQEAGQCSVRVARRPDQEVAQGQRRVTLPGLCRMRVVKKAATKAREGDQPLTGEK